MGIVIRIAAFAALFAALVTGAPARAQTVPAATAVDPATWGIYTRLVGTTRQNPESFNIAWRWQETGRVLIEEYTKPGGGKIAQTSYITPGPTPGTLVLNASTYLGKKQWNGTVQPDGSVVFLGTGMLKMNYKAVLAEDGTYEIRQIKVQGGQVVSVGDAIPVMSYRLSASDMAASVATTAAPATPQAANTSVPRQTAVGEVTPKPPVVALQAAPQPSTPTASAKPPTSKATAQPRSVAATSAASTTGSKAKPTVPAQHPLTELVDRLIAGQQAVGGGGWTRAQGEAMVVEFMRTPTGDRAVYHMVGSDGGFIDIPLDWQLQPDGTVISTMGTTRHRLRVTRRTNDAFVIDTIPDDGPADQPATSSETYRFLDALSYENAGSFFRASSSADAMAHLGAEDEANRAKAARHQQYVADTLHAAGFLTDEEAEAQDDSDIEEQMAAKRAAWNAMASQNEQGLADSLQNLNNTVANIAAQARAQSAQESGSSGTESYRPSYSPSSNSAPDDDSDGASASPASAVAATPPREDAAPGKSLRFVLSIGLQPRAGDTTNPTCYSTVVTRGVPGPGWGTGQMNSEYQTTYANAKSQVDALKSSFIAACRSTSGREITSEGDFHWTWNETRDGDAQIANTRAQYREDVTVSL